MARPKAEVTREINIRVMMSDEEYQEIIEMAERLDLPISTFMRNLILYAKKDAELMDKIGLFKGIKKVEGWFEKDLKAVGAGQAQ